MQLKRHRDWHRRDHFYYKPYKIFYKKHFDKSLELEEKLIIQASNRICNEKLNP